MLGVELIKLFKQVVYRLCKEVHLLLQLLHVLRSFVLVGAFLILVAFIFLQVSSFSLLYLFLNLLLDSFHILAHSNLDFDLSFELEHGFTDDLVVEVNHVRGNLLVEFGELVHDWLHV